jgi:hypothetical protein
MDVEHDAGCRRCGLPVDFSPTRIGAELAVVIDGQPAVLHIIEQVPVDPAAFCYEAGWMIAYSGNLLGLPEPDPYFVSASGIVYRKDPSVEWRDEFTIECGVCPLVKEQAEQAERIQAEAEIEAERLEDEAVRAELEHSHTFDLLGY